MQKTQSPLRKIVISVISILALMCLCLCLISWAAQGQGANTRPTQTSQPKTKVTGNPTEPEQRTSPPQPTETPSAGNTRENPHPFNTPVDIGNGIQMTVVGITRSVDGVVRSGNIYNQKPEKGQEYIKIDLTFECKKDSSAKCLISPYGFKAVGGDGNIWEPAALLVGVDGVLEQSEIFGGATKKGSLFFIVTKDDLPIILFKDSLFGGQTYFATK